MTLTLKELTNYLTKIYSSTPIDEELPPDWEIVAYSLIEVKSADASDFLKKKTKKPLVKV